MTRAFFGCLGPGHTDVTRVPVAATASSVRLDSKVTTVLADKVTTVPATNVKWLIIW